MIESQLRLTATMGAYRTSMQIDRAEDRPMEVEAILGEPLRRGRAGGADMPHLQMIYELARLIDAARAEAAAGDPAPPHAPS
jgi:2-dehydropantoate 2-reductase